MIKEEEYVTCKCTDGIGFIRLEKVLEIIPVSKSTWWNGCKSGRFPKPYKLSSRTTAWKLADIKTCIENFHLKDPK